MTDDTGERWDEDPGWRVVRALHRRVRHRPRLRTWVRTRFFLRNAFAQSIALFAFVLFFIQGPRWI